MAARFSLEQYGIGVEEIHRNLPAAVLYEHALEWDRGSAISASGALIAMSGVKTGRSPTDKRIIDDPNVAEDVWWGKVNMKLEQHAFEINRTQAIDFLNTRDQLYVVDAFAGWDPKYRIKVRVICARPYHALFMRNMLIRPTAEQLAEFGEPDYVIFNAGSFPANRNVPGMTSGTSINLQFGHREMVILGTEYAGEMKKGVFTIMNYLMPAQGVLSMHCSATEGEHGDTSILFGLSGTGKTTLSADPKRRLTGDQGLVIPRANTGSVLENVVYDEGTREVDYEDTSITANTRGSYPIEYIDNVKIPCMGGHPKNIIFLTCDAFGVLPPVSRLTPEQAMYHFISGYTAKVAGTEVGVTEPEATFSPCFGGPFLVWHPAKYAELLAEHIRKHDANVWLVNTGWSGGAYGTGKRMKLAFTRAIIDAIHSGELAQQSTAADPIFGLAIPQSCPGVPDEILIPRNTWSDKADYDATAHKLARLFADNFAHYEDVAGRAISEAGPRVKAA